MKVDSSARARYLLEALLCENDAEVLEKWSVWYSASNDLEGLLSVEFRLLPFAWKKLSALGFEAEDSRLKGIYKKTWFYNTVLLKTAAEVQALLRSHGVESALYKGCALLVDTYQDIALRQSSDIDLLVKDRDARKASLILDSIYPEKSKGRVAVQYSGLGRRGVDLHWATSTWFEATSLQFRSRTIDTAELFERSRLVTKGANTVRVLDPTDLLFHNLLNLFVNSPPNSPYRSYWVLDAMALLESHSIEEDRFIDLIVLEEATALFQANFRAQENLLPNRLRTIAARVRGLELSARDLELAEAIERVVERHESGRCELAYEVWWLALRAGGRPFRKQYYKIKYVLRRLGEIADNFGTNFGIIKRVLSSPAHCIRRLYLLLMN